MLERTGGAKFVYNYCGRGEEVVKETERNIVRIGGIW